MEIYTRLCEEFATDEQLLFINNFHSYLMNDPDNDFVIDLDKAVKFIGFARKDHAKRLLNKVIEQDKVRIQRIQEVSNMHGGQNREKILLTTNAFKELCLCANTDTSKRIRQYYIKMENIFMRHLKEQLESNTGELQTANDKVKYLETELMKVSKKKKIQYPMGDTVYILWDRANDVYKVGCSSNMNARKTQYHTSCNNTFVVYTRRCKNQTYVENAVHALLAQHQYNQRKDWFKVDFETIRQCVDDMQIRFDGQPMEFVLDPMINERSRTNPAVQDTSRQPPQRQRTIKPVSNYELFFEECFVRKENAKTPWIDITARYRLWSRRIETVYDEIAAYMRTQGFTECFVYDPISMTNAKAWMGIEMTPLDQFSINEHSCEMETFLADTCSIVTTARVTVFELYPTFVEWMKQKDPSYETITTEHKKRLKEFCNDRFVGSIVHDGTHRRFGYYGLCLKGNEHIGRKFKKNNCKAVCQINAHTNEIVQKFVSQTHAAAELGLTMPRISSMITSNTVHDGYRYAFDEV